MLYFLRLIRWKNLVMILLTQVLIKYALFAPLHIDVALDDFSFSLLVFSTLCIAAAGNIINDIYDVETDIINKPNRVIVGKSIPESLAYNLFLGFSIVGVGIGFYISNLIGRSGFSALFILTSALLYVYSSYLKQTVLIGNIVVSALVATSIIMVGIFDLLPAITPENQHIQLGIFKILLGYSLFAFMLNMLREIIKDIEDLEGDTESGMRTLPVVLGREASIKVVFVLSLLPPGAILLYITNYLYQEQWAVIYFLLFIVGPLLYFSIKIMSAKKNKALNHLSNVLKLVMLAGILSLILYPLTQC